MLNPMDGNKELTELKSGNRSVIRAIYARVLPKVQHLICQLGGSTEDANDIFQEALETILVKIDDVQHNFDGLVLQISRHKWIDRIRKNSREQVRNSAATRLLEEAPGSDDRILEKEREYLQYKIMEKTFSSLSEKCQRLLTLIRQGKQPSEIVKILDFSSTNTLYRRKFACIERWSILVKQSAEYKLMHA